MEGEAQAALHGPMNPGIATAMTAGSQMDAGSSDPQGSEPRTSLAEQIHSTLEREILEGSLPGGTQLDEQLLAERFGVSRTPAREALIRLAAIGLVELRPRQGAVVSSVSLRDYVAFSEILVQLEALAARLATRRMSPGEIGELEAALASCSEAAGAVDPEAYRRANARFHEVIYAGCRNQILAREIRIIRARMRGLRDLRFENPARMRDSFAEHTAICTAIRNADENAAADAMALHISTGSRSLEDIIATMG